VQLADKPPLSGSNLSANRRPDVRLSTPLCIILGDNKERGMDVSSGKDYDNKTEKEVLSLLRTDK